MNKEDTILIEIAAYCDPELLNTINSALIQADNPGRVHFSICYQSDNLEDLEKLKKIKNCKYIHLKENEARGSVYARYLCQSLIEDEKYVYQIDSHMRFVKHWDTKLIEQLLSLNDKKAILSVYPPYCTEEMMHLPLDDKTYDNPVEGGIMYTNGFRDTATYFLNCNSLPINDDDPRAYKRNVFIAAGNFFTFSEAHKEVIHDKEMYFYGDELPMSIRLFTYGWNVYNPGKSYIYHQYERKNQKFPSVTNAMLIESNRLASLLNLGDKKEELGKFGLGKERTLKEYEEFAGLNFKDKKVYMTAETGEFENKELKNKQSYIQKKQAEKYKEMLKQENVEVIIIDLFEEYKECIKSCLKHSTYPNKIKFLVATNDKRKASEKYISENNIKEIIYLKDENYVQALAKTTEFLGNSYVAIIDSSIRFMDGWDKEYCQKIKECGNNSALTCWVWQADDKVDPDNFYNYNNIVKELDTFINFLPVLKYNETIDLAKRNAPYQTPFISDGFVFCKSNVLKNVLVDPNLTYEEHQYLYSVRLWTNGINIYYPPVSYMIRTKPENLLHGSVIHQDVICGLTGQNNYYSKTMPSDYKYGLGNERPICSWYDFMKVNYDATSMQIIDPKKEEVK